MKRLALLLVVLLLLAVTATPALAQAPQQEPFDYSEFPFRTPLWLSDGGIGIVNGAFFGFVHGVITAIAVAALGALVVVMLPSQTKQVSATAEQSALQSLGVGCLTVLVMVPLIVLFAVLIITIPAAVILPFAIAVAWLFGWIALGWLVGEKVLHAVNARESLRMPIVAVMVGVLLLAVLSQVPLIGWLIGLVIGLVGLGAVVLTRFGTRGYPVAAPATTTDLTNAAS